MRALRNCALFEVGSNGRYLPKQFTCLVLAAALASKSLEETSQQTDLPSADDFYYHARQKLSKEAVQRQIHRWASEAVNAICNVFGTRSFDIAVDFTEDCYYGDIDNPWVVGGKRKNSTNYAFKYLTVAIVNNGVRFVIYACPVSKDDKMDAPLVEEAILSVKRLGIGIRRAYLDREFKNSALFLFFDVKGIEFIVPNTADSKTLRWIDEFRREKKQFPRIIENYEVNDYPVNLLLLEDEDGSGEIYGFLTNRKATEIKKDPYAVAEDYRNRWAIENANKYQDAFNIPTNCRDGIVRYLFFAMTVLLHNFWVLATMIAPFICLPQPTISFFKECILTILLQLPRLRSKSPQREHWAAVLGGKIPTLQRWADAALRCAAKWYAGLFFGDFKIVERIRAIRFYRTEVFLWTCGITGMPLSPLLLAFFSAHRAHHGAPYSF